MFTYVQISKHTTVIHNTAQYSSYLLTSRQTSKLRRCLLEAREGAYTLAQDRIGISWLIKKRMRPVGHLPCVVCAWAKNPACSNHTKKFPHLGTWQTWNKSRKEKGHKETKGSKTLCLGNHMSETCKMHTYTHTHHMPLVIHTSMCICKTPEMMKDTAARVIPATILWIGLQIDNNTIQSHWHSARHIS